VWLPHSSLRRRAEGVNRGSLLGQQLFDVSAEEFFAFGAFPIQLAHPPVAHVTVLVEPSKANIDRRGARKL
jgi:hypothetical protein